MSPDAVVVPPDLPRHLEAQARRLDGALALVSGRTLDSIDALFAPLRLSAVGLHGLERRSPGKSIPAPAPPDTLATIQRQAIELIAAHPGAVVEDKGSALALHWRGVPEAGPALENFAAAALPRLPGYRLQHGDHVVELRLAAGDKGAAIRALLDEAPFHGRTPVFAGDDLTDESGFVTVNKLGGISILVGDRAPSAAHFSLPDPPAVRDWLDTIPLARNAAQGAFAQ